MIHARKHAELGSCATISLISSGASSNPPAKGAARSEAQEQSADDERHLLGAANRSPWRDLPERYGPYTTVYNRFNRWRKAGIWDRLMDAIVKAHDGEVQMIDSSIVRVHQHASGGKKESGDRCVGRSRGGLTTKIHARGRRPRPAGPALITPGQAHDLTAAEPPARCLEPRTIVLADKAYDADRICDLHRGHGAIPNIPTRSKRKEASAGPRRSTASATTSSASSTSSKFPPHRHPLRQARRQLLRLRPARRRPNLSAIN